MSATQTHTKHCVVCDRDRPARQCEPTGVLRRALASFIESRHAEHWDVDGYVCHACLSWIGINSWLLQAKAFDPYPYILLNLVLSCLAAIQAPIIMMSQNRASARDRIRADEDYKINLKAELEIHALHDKIDHLLHVQWERMAEIQQTQLEVLRELSERPRS